MSRLLAICGLSVCMSGAMSAMPISLKTWYAFTSAPVKGCISICGIDPAYEHAEDPPWTFSGEGLLTVVDAYGTDQFAVFDRTRFLGLTSTPGDNSTCSSDPFECLVDPDASKGFFFLGPGDHSIRMVANPGGSGGVSYFRVDPASAEAPEPQSALLIGAGGILFGIMTVWRRIRGLPENSLINPKTSV